MNDKLHGFILSISDYKEADCMMQVISKEYGMLTLIGKSSKKISSKNHFMPLCSYEFIIDYKDNKNIYTVHGSKLLNSYYENDDLMYMSFKNIIVELTLKYKEFVDYESLMFVFEKMNKENRYLLGSMYLSYLIKNFGITPYVDGCVICNRKQVVSLSNKNGGFVCNDHLSGLEPLQVDHLKKFRLVIKGSFEHYDILKDFDYDLKDFGMLCDFMIDNTGVNLKSYNFYKTL
ncbi:MAG: DNA repair protein RecO [Erysipelotrichaceae bacterium]|nr:DNA repair protein RecO [Erysipelotrichaceae bacterium]